MLNVCGGGSGARSIRKTITETMRWDVSERHAASVARGIEGRGYSGPLALATDCTATLPSLRFDARFLYVVGDASGPVEVNTLQDIREVDVNGRE